MNPYINVIIISLMPIAECRGAIPYGLINGMDVTTVAILSFLGNIIPVPFILLLMNKLEAIILRHNNLKKIYVKYINNLRKRSSNVVEKYGFYGLIIFIALPLPGTGAWTGSIVAHIFGIKLIKALFAIFIGVAIAVVIVTITTIIIL
ncbi:MAG: small multi-drug export protein [Candidatus Methanomethyliaceae archaeon]|nr:small multi-drug export protein [Candidatus Methanomethyliaceae archaeon]MDW7970276.1 small multi-drug export protein [Nitrososphaerota archaeon]